MLRFLKRGLAFLRGAELPSASHAKAGSAGHITEVGVDPAKCLAYEWCVHVCPAVFEFRDACARVRPDAANYFESHKAQILRAEAECPVEAIKVRVEGS